MVDSRAKGARAEYSARDLLRKYTGLPWERTPSSGALEYLKGDLYIPNSEQKYTIEVKNYEESSINDKILVNTTNNFVNWWPKLLLQAKNTKPILFYKYNRSKFFVGVNIPPITIHKYIHIMPQNCYIMVAEDWLKNEWHIYDKTQN